MYKMSEVITETESCESTLHKHLLPDRRMTAAADVAILPQMQVVHRQLSSLPSNVILTVDMNEDVLWSLQRRQK